MNDEAQQVQAMKRSEDFTLEMMAQEAGVDVAMLRELGIAERMRDGRRAVRFTYGDETGEIAARFVVARGDDTAWHWRAGDDVRPLFNVTALSRPEAKERVFVVFDEIEAIALHAHGLPAVAVPRGVTWCSEWNELFAGIEEIVVARRGDTDSEALDWIATSPMRERVRLLDHKRVSSFMGGRAHDPDLVSEWLAQAIDAAPTWAEQWSREKFARASHIARSGDVLKSVVAEARRLGFAGDTRGLEVLYLVATSRLFTKPVSAVLKGESSSGKTFTLSTALRFMPPEAVFRSTALSEKAIVHTDESFRHRLFVLEEASGISADGFMAYMLRSLISEHRIRYEVTDMDNGGTKVIEKDGPTAFVSCTTRNYLDRELETRLLSLPTSDTPEQTRNVMRAVARGTIEVDPDELAEWHAFQQWLASRPVDIDVPFAEALADLVNARAVRMRRDLGSFLGLVRAHALVNQECREIDDEGKIVATIDDYAAVYGLVAEWMSHGVGAAISFEIRETVDAINDLHESSVGGPIRIGPLAQRLGLDESSTRRRVHKAIDAGFVENEASRGRPLLVKTCDVIPDDEDVFPTPERLNEAWSEQFVAA